jgi:hypothetical protein
MQKAENESPIRREDSSAVMPASSENAEAGLQSE